MIAELVDYRSLLLNSKPLIDVRAPIEFTRGAFPAAVNLPLMTDEERHLVGIRYKQAGQESAIALGAELISDAERQLRTERWLAFVNRHPDGALYCFRGGLRSRISQQWIAEAGLDYPLVSGGYKALRTYLVESLAELTQRLPFTLIGGRTGSGKTLLIRQLQRSVDLEGLANHRGSSFGNVGTAQPSNIDFENALGIALLKLDDASRHTVYLEDEARMIGKVCLPEPLREHMQSSPTVILETTMEQRVNIAFADYVTDLLARYQAQHESDAGFDAYAAHHRGSLFRVRKRLGGDNYSAAVALLDAALAAHRQRDDREGYRAFIELMLTRYYDPMYDYQLSGKQQRVVFSGDAPAVRDWILQQR